MTTPVAVRAGIFPCTFYMEVTERLPTASIIPILPPEVMASFKTITSPMEW